MNNMLRNLRVAMLCTLLSASFLAESQTNLIVNPSAETALSTEWVSVRNGTVCTSGTRWRMTGSASGYPPAQSGSYFFMPGCGGSVDGTTYEVYQDVNMSTYGMLIDAGQYQISFSGYMQSFDQTPPEQTNITVEYWNSAKTSRLATYSSGTVSNISVWRNYSFTNTLPPSTRYVRIRLIGTYHSGDAIDSYFDNLSLTGLSLLPVNMMYFNTSVANNKVLLDWQTNNERNNKGFTVERSADGLAWKSIGFVAAKGTAVNNYSYTDETPFTGNNYYRLVQEDVDGKKKNSEAKFIKIGSSQKPSFFPNPVKDIINIRSLSSTAIVSIVNAAGITHGRYTKQNIINVEHLSAGVYYLKVEDGGNVEMLKFMKL